MSTLQTNPTKAAFTIVEIMVATTILGLISIALAAFTLNSSEGLFWAANKSKITSDVRSFTMQISQETLGARTGIIYKSFDSADRSGIDDQKQTGETGDCLVLVYYDPYPDIGDPPHYTKIIVFFRSGEQGELSPVYRAEKTFSTPQEIDTTQGIDHFETMLAENFSDAPTNYPIVLELSRGLANGDLFKNFGNNTFVINGEILHGNSIKEVTNTYNLTISPRG